MDEEDGSFSPELMHGNEDEDAIDPDEDKAEMVHCAFYSNRMLARMEIVIYAVKPISLLIRSSNTTR